MNSVGSPGGPPGVAAHCPASSPTCTTAPLAVAAVTSVVLIVTVTVKSLGPNPEYKKGWKMPSKKLGGPSTQV